VTANSSAFRNTISNTYSYGYKKPIPYGVDGSDDRTDTIFNISSDNSILGGGEGVSFLASNQENVNDPFRHCRVAYDQSTTTVDDGFTISGFLFPADRGTVALLHWASSYPNVSYTSASSVGDISSRVLGAVNLGLNKIKEDDISIFTEGEDQFSFPSKMTGQYDLREIQTGNKRNDLSDGGLAIPSLQANKSNSLGSVRILRDPSACFFGNDVSTVDSRGNLPVLFGAYSWDSNTTAWVENTTNFLAYRLPTLVNYNPVGLKTPNSERERYFSVVQPASTVVDFTSAGNYGTFGDDYYTFQVARFRHVVNYSDYGLTNESKGAFALVHFKNEDAFEKLVRDGIAPSEDDLWSVNFLNALEAENINNFVAEGEDYTDVGIPVLAPLNKDSVTNTIVKPNVFISTRDSNNKINDGDVAFTKILVRNNATTLNAPDSNFKSQLGYFTTISGCKYLLPTTYEQTSLYSGDLPDSYSKILLSTTCLQTAGASIDTEKPSYYANEATNSSERKFNEPYDPFFLNLSSFTGENNLSIYMARVGAYQSVNPLTQSVSFSLEDTSVNAPAELPHTLHSFETYIYTNGDTGLCSFSTESYSSLYVRDPAYNSDGFGVAKTINLSPTKPNLMYHSARLISLVENVDFDVDRDKVYVHTHYTAGARNADQAFAIFRYDQEGFRVYQSLTLEANSALELCSGQAKIGVGTFPDYPVYRPTTNNDFILNNLDKDQHVATLVVVEEENYYVEAQPNFGNGAFNVSFRGGGDYIDLVANDYTTLNNKDLIVDQIYTNSTAFDSRVAGYGLTYFEITNVGVSSHNLNNTFMQYLHLGFDILEVARVSGSDLPSYGNFLESSNKIISVMGLGTNDPLSGAMNVFNPLGNVGSVQRTPLSSLFTARKDTQERFLDEAYRINTTFEGMTDKENLAGEGLPLGSRANAISTRDDGVWGVENHGASAYLRYGHHWTWSIYTNQTQYTDGNGDNYYKEGEAQIRGLPNFSNMVLSGAKYGSPRRGILTRPQNNFQGATYYPNETYDASWVNDPVATPAKYNNQPDYSGTSAFTTRNFSYVRVFDVEFSRSGTVENMKGRSQFKLRVVGCDFADFSFNTANRGLIISVKIPGLTTWLDIGRYNKSGVSKQHISIDGAGCLISYQEGILIDEDLKCVDLTLELGSNASFIKNTSGECPLLVKATFTQEANASSLDFGESGNTNIPFSSRKGLVGLEILRASNGNNYDEDVVQYL
jgi:hypothetical protein